MEGDVTKVLNAMSRGEAVDSDQLLRAVYDELRQLAAQKLAREKPGHTLEATALVHEVYLRLGATGQTWANQRHFFAAAAEAMRRILVESARRKHAQKRGRGRHRSGLDDCDIAAPQLAGDVVAVHEALDDLAKIDSQAAELVKLRFFVGFTIPEAAEALGVSPRTADNIWTYARAWLFDRLDGPSRG